MKGKCFICSIANYEFERRSKVYIPFSIFIILAYGLCQKGFRHHVKHEHSMWNYIYFHLYLERIDISDHNAIESYTYHKVSLMIIDLLVATLCSYLRYKCFITIS